MPLPIEFWSRDIAPNLFKNNEFVSKSVNDDAWVKGDIVHLPQAGSTPNVVVDRTTFPAVITQRTDTELTYQLKKFTSDPTHIEDADEMKMSYAKRTSVLTEHVSTINEKMADWIAYYWQPTLATNIIPTSGANRTIGIAPGAAGTRKMITLDDVRKVMMAMDKQNIPRFGRYCVLDTDMYSDLMQDSNFRLLNRDWVDSGKLPEGVVDRVLGFNVFLRSSVARYATGNTVAKDPTIANVATDNAASIFWHEKFVRRALGEVKVYSDLDRPDYYGSIFSTMCKAGAKTAYTNGRGVVAIAEVP